MLCPGHSQAGSCQEASHFDTPHGREVLGLSFPTPTPTPPPDRLTSLAITYTWRRQRSPQDSRSTDTARWWESVVLRVHTLQSLVEGHPGARLCSRVKATVNPPTPPPLQELSLAGGRQGARAGGAFFLCSNCTKCPKTYTDVHRWSIWAGSGEASQVRSGEDMGVPGRGSMSKALILEQKAGSRKARRWLRPSSPFFWEKGRDGATYIYHTAENRSQDSNLPRFLLQSPSSQGLGGEQPRGGLCSYGALGQNLPGAMWSPLLKVVATSPLNHPGLVWTMMGRWALGRWRSPYKCWVTSLRRGGCCCHFAGEETEA